MNLKQKIRNCKKNLAAEYKNMKRWIEDPEGYVLHSCGNERENAITHAVYELGKLDAYKQLERELSK